MKKNCMLNLVNEAGSQKQLLLLFFLMFNLMVYGQRRRCGTDEMADQLATTDSAYIQRRDSLERERLILINSTEYQKFKEDHITPKGPESGAFINRQIIFFYSNDRAPVKKEHGLIALISY